MTNHAATLFDEPWPEADDDLLLADLAELVDLGLLEEQPSPDGPTYALTSLGREVSEPRRR